MGDKELPAIGGMTFEEFKRTNEHGAEYWSSRDLQQILGYTQWRRFEQAVERAVTSCRQSGNKPDYHFAGAGKMVDLGSGSQREVEDYHLSMSATGVREAIKRIGGTLPGNISPAEQSDALCRQEMITT